MAQVEAEKESMITPRESGISRAVIASEKRPHPAEGWVETEIQGKKFKLGGPLSEDTRRQIAGVMRGIWTRLRGQPQTCQVLTQTSSAIVLQWTLRSDRCAREGGSLMRRGR